MGSLESFLRPAETPDFSEQSLRCTHGFDYDPCLDGGNNRMATAYLARWSGPVSETCCPYNPYGCGAPPPCEVQKHVQEVIFLPERSGPLDNDAIKDAVMNFGAVATSMYYDDGYYRSTTRAYYFAASTYSNHGICIVGWNDDYPASNFKTMPPGNGAFIVRNSWGSSWGESGYFYISYYDGVIGRENAVYRAEPASNFGRRYEYDTLGWVGSMGYGSATAWFANIFTSVNTEPVRAVGFYAPVPGSVYEVYVYQNPTWNPRTGTLQGSKSGTLTHAGYHTVMLDTPAWVTGGYTFSVVVRLTAPGVTYPIAIEYPVGGYSSAATAHVGESYISYDGTSYSWTDLAAYNPNHNVCLKAFTGFPADTTPPTVISVTRLSPLVQATNTGSVTWRVTFSEEVDATTASPADFTLADASHTITGESIASTTPTSGSSTTIDVTANTGSGDGTLRLDVIGVTASINDIAGNDIIADFTSGQTYIIDKTPPAVTINQAAGQPDPCTASPIRFTAVFSEPVTGFAADDVTIGGTAGATSVAVTEIAPNNQTTYDVAVTGMTGSGTVIVSIGAARAQDAAGNGNQASTSTDNSVTYDATPPPDCNNNGVPDAQDIANGTSTDCDGDGVPDECGCHATPQDSDGDGDVDLGDFTAFQRCFNGPNLSLIHI